MFDRGLIDSVETVAEVSNAYVLTPQQQRSPRLARSLLFFVIDSVCLSVCQSITLLLQIASSFFCFPMESSHFLDVSSPCGTLQICFLRFLI